MQIMLFGVVLLYDLIITLDFVFIVFYFLLEFVAFVFEFFIFLYDFQVLSIVLCHIIEDDFIGLVFGMTIM